MPIDVPRIAALPAKWHWELSICQHVEAAGRNCWAVIAPNNNPIIRAYCDQAWREKKINPKLRLDTAIQYLWLEHLSQVLTKESEAAEVFPLVEGFTVSALKTQQFLFDAAAPSPSFPSRT